MVLADGQRGFQRFSIPDALTFINARCTACGGNVIAQDGHLSCLMCARNVIVTDVAASGHILSLECVGGLPGKLTRVGRLERRRVHRSLARERGLTGRAARALAIVPPSPSKVGRSFVAKRLGISTLEAGEALDILLRQDLIEEIIYGDSHHYIGYSLKAAV